MSKLGALNSALSVTLQGLQQFQQRRPERISPERTSKVDVLIHVSGLALKAGLAFQKHRPRNAAPVAQRSGAAAAAAEPGAPTPADWQGFVEPEEVADVNEASAPPPTPRAASNPFQQEFTAQQRVERLEGTVYEQMQATMRAHLRGPDASMPFVATQPTLSGDLLKNLSELRNLSAGTSVLLTISPEQLEAHLHRDPATYLPVDFDRREQDAMLLATACAAAGESWSDKMAQADGDAARTTMLTSDTVKQAFDKLSRPTSPPDDKPHLKRTDSGIGLDEQYESNSAHV